MNTLFGVLLILAATLYSIKVVAYFLVLCKESYRKSVEETQHISISTYAWGGLEHLFFMITLIGSAVLLLSI